MRFFLDFVDGSYSTEDREGHEYENSKAACVEVLRTLPDLLMDELERSHNREIVCSIRDESGSVVYQASIILRELCSVKS